VSTLPVDEWIRGVEDARANSSAAGRAFFALPSTREPAEKERADAERIAFQEAARRRARTKKRWRERTGRTEPPELIALPVAPALGEWYT